VRGQGEGMASQDGAGAERKCTNVALS
jgi:hypothetical protein